jgi:hypothetical protein
MGLAALATIGESNSNTATKTESGTGASGAVTTSPDVPSTFHVGDTIKLGDWEVIVHGVTDPLESTNQYLKPKAGNRWVGVDTEVKNNSGKPAMVSSLVCFELQDDKNQSYSITITGANAASLDGEADPGGARRGTLSYEVPQDATGLKLRFKCDLFSSGSATISLS